MTWNQACWQWLSINKNGIPKELFLLYSKNESQLKCVKNDFDAQCVHINFKTYVYNIISRIDTRCLLYRQELILRGTDTNNASEVMFHLLKDIALDQNF